MGQVKGFGVGLKLRKGSLSVGIGEDMAAMKSDEQSARYILALFRDKFNARAGHVLLPHFFAAEFQISPWTAEDFRRGCDYAAGQGWIEVNKFGSLRLTDKGAAA